MLRSFRMGNHRSFRDEQELLLMPVYAKDREALPVAAVYGANASGKSNLLDGLEFMADAVRDSFSLWTPGGGVPRRPFKLDPTAEERPSVFVAEFVENGVRYTYGFEVDSDRVLAEWLYSYPHGRKRVVFDRSGDRIKAGKDAVDGAAKMEVLMEFLRPNVLFLSLAALSNVVVVLAPYRWLTEKLWFRSSGGTFDLAAELADFVDQNADLRPRLVELLRAADLGISDIEVGHIEPDYSDIPSEFRAFVKWRRDQRAGSATREERRRRVRLVHGVGRIFELADESAGTRSWLRLLPDVFRILRDGGVLIIDEIDESLHSLLTARLVALFNDAQTNVGNGQLIFTTHDATLLHPPLADEVLDRDQVWFVEKGENGASTLYPLSDFRPRREDNLERRYLAGQYGAVPNVYEELFARAVRGDGDGEA